MSSSLCSSPRQRHSSIEQCAKAVSFLSTEVDTVFFKGETVVGDGTTAQLSAMFTGLAEENQTEARQGQPGAKTVDDWNWIFRDYIKHGYATMFSEDDASLAAFNYRLVGFKEPPTDHYARPFWIHFLHTSFRKERSNYCAEGQAIHNISFRYLEDFSDAYLTRPKFGCILFSFLSHGDQNALNYADEDLVQLLRNLNKKSHLNNSIVVIFGDHGYRFSSWRKTTHGKLEERLPHLSITLPNWFRWKYPDVYNNLKYNAEVLTTPFDVYATLKHILSYPIKPTNITTGQSLLNRIDEETRTCADAGVASHWCPCMQWKKLDPVQEIASNTTNITKAILEHLNNLTSASPELINLCHRLRLKKINAVFKQMPHEDVQTFVRTKGGAHCDFCTPVYGKKARDTLTQLYQVQFVVTPGGGVFEATVQLRKGLPVVDSKYISRLNAYGGQSHCVRNQPHLLKYCFCKLQ